MHELTIDLIRHGATSSHKSLLGRTDPPLSEEGWQQLECLTQSEQIPWQKIMSSPLQRCLSLASQLSSQHDVPLSIEPDFQEMAFGDWDGQLLSDLYNGPHQNTVTGFFNDPSKVTPPNGEAFAEFEARVLHGWDRLFETLMAEPVQHAVLITHGGVIKVILKQLLGLTADKLSQLAVANAGVTRIQRYLDYPDRLVFHSQVVTDVRQLFI